MEKWELALKDKRAGMKMQDIADKHGVSINTVKSWQKRHWKKKKGAPKAGGKGAPSKRGAPKGNNNAYANNGGAPEGNTNNLQHGLYSSALITTALSAEELDLVKGLEIEPETLLEEQIKMLAVREVRVLKIIHVLGNSKTAITAIQALRMETREEMPKDFPPELVDELAPAHRKYQRGDYEGQYKRHSYQLHTTSVANIELIGRYEAELTRIQKAMIKATEALNKIRQDSGSTGDKDLVEAWISGVVEEDGGADE